MPKSHFTVWTATLIINLWCFCLLHSMKVSECVCVICLNISGTVHSNCLTLGDCIAGDPRMCSVSFGAIWARNMFYTDKLWIKNSTLQLFAAAWAEFQASRECLPLCKQRPGKLATVKSPSTTGEDKEGKDVRLHFRKFKHFNHQQWNFQNKCFFPRLKEAQGSAERAARHPHRACASA